MPLLILFVLYFLPAIVAHSRRSVSSTGIFIVNFLFGWTGIGWCIALLWALLSTSWHDFYWRRSYNQGPSYHPQRDCALPGSIPPPGAYRDMRPTVQYYAPQEYSPRYPGRW